jgi:hypothetical protein
MKKKQTAVEWLIEQITAGKIEIVYSNKMHSIRCIPEIIQIAEQIEVSQIINAYHSGALDFQEAKECRSQEVPYIDDAVQYYLKTYSHDQPDEI